MNKPGRPFRIEQSLAHTTGSHLEAMIFHPSPDSLNQGDRIIQEIRALREFIQPAQAISQSVIETVQKEIQQLASMKSEMDQIQDMIANTKREIASLHYSGFKGQDFEQFQHDLDAVISGTEQATDDILSAAEVCDERAAMLCAKMNGNDEGLSGDIQDAVVRIFEACNFQDITGQRITKVVRALRFIEERIDSMAAIWDDLEHFKEEVAYQKPEDENEALLHGPSLSRDIDTSSQDDIDALFA